MVAVVVVAPEIEATVEAIDFNRVEAAKEWLQI
jgi:hypothetical protein